MENKKYCVVVSEQASQMLISNAAFLAQINEKAANRLVDEFERTMHSLETMPFRCPRLTGEYFSANIYRFIVFEDRYMLIFKIVDEIVYVDYVVDCRQDYRWIIK